MTTGSHAGSEILLADVVFLTQWNPATRLAAPWPRGQGKQGSFDAVIQAAVLADLVGGGHAALQSKSLSDSTEITAVATAVEPAHPLLHTAWVSLANQKSHALRRQLIWLETRMSGRAVELGLIDRRREAPFDDFLTESGKATAAKTRAELVAWAKRDDVDASAAARGRESIPATSDLSADSRALAALLLEGDVWARVWPGLSADEYDRVNSRLHLARNESLSEARAHWDVILRQLAELTTPTMG
ncbi:hypothetical protein [Glaciihabitans sp. dw_435]|uniref:hypothetical protein n=1 Tax=Glaciihabitans sp. dw_435 TaxID=2720081 RepID=UPI001BD51812|nr:hypothetical protein [Glaciihabitans sp. dw_435]